MCDVLLLNRLTAREAEGQSKEGEERGRGLGKGGRGGKGDDVCSGIGHAVPYACSMSVHVWVAVHCPTSRPSLSFLLP